MLLDCMLKALFYCDDKDEVCIELFQGTDLVD